MKTLNSWAKEFYPYNPKIVKENFGIISLIIRKLSNQIENSNSKDRVPKRIRLYKIDVIPYETSKEKWVEFSIYGEPFTDRTSTSSISTIQASYCLNGTEKGKRPRQSKDYGKIHIDSQKLLEQILQILLKDMI